MRFGLACSNFSSQEVGNGLGSGYFLAKAGTASAAASIGNRAKASNFFIGVPPRVRHGCDGVGLPFLADTVILRAVGTLSNFLEGHDADDPGAPDPGDGDPPGPPVCRPARPQELQEALRLVLSHDGRPADH